MALLWADGFDHYGTDQAFVSTGTYEPGWWHLDTTVARTGQYCAYSDGYGVIHFPYSVLAGGVGFAFRVTQLGGDKRHAFGNSLHVSDGTKRWSWRENANGSISVHKNSAGEQVFVSGPNLIQTNSWNYIEWFWQFPITGDARLMLKLNGATLYDDYVSWAGNAPIDSMIILPISCGYVFIDDYVIYDTFGTTNNGPLGDIRCRTLLPNANGSLQQWTVSGDTNAYMALSHIPSNANDHYIAGQNVGDAVDVGISSLPINTSYVFGVVVSAQFSKTDANTCSVVTSIESGSQSQDSDPYNPGVGSSYVLRVFETDPDGGGPWSRNTVNQARIKFVRSA